MSHPTVSGPRQTDRLVTADTVLIARRWAPFKEVSIQRRGQAP